MPADFRQDGDQEHARGVVYVVTTPGRDGEIHDLEILDACPRWHWEGMGQRVFKGHVNGGDSVEIRRTNPLLCLPTGSEIWCQGPDYSDDPHGELIGFNEFGGLIVRFPDGTEGYPMDDEIVCVSVGWQNEHADDCPVTHDRQRLADDLQADPLSPYLLGAVPEWDEGGDEEAEQCLCGAAPGFEGVEDD